MLLLDARRVAENDTGGGDSPGVLLFESWRGCFSGETGIAGTGTGVTLVFEVMLFVDTLWAGRARWAWGEIWNTPFGGKILLGPGDLDTTGEDDWLMVEYARDLFGDCCGGDKVGCGDENGLDPSVL